MQGSLLADEHAVVGAKIAGLIKEVKVDIGTAVQRGQLLATLDTEELDLRVQKAQAQLEQARAKLGLKPAEPDEKLDRQHAPAVLQEAALLEEAKGLMTRARTLAGQRAVSLEELQQREAALRVAEARYTSALNNVEEQVAALAVHRAELALARQAQADARIVAPFDGVIEERPVAPGVYLQIGDPVVSLVRTDPLRFHAGIPERQAMQVRLKQKVQLYFEGEPAPLLATVSRISPALDRSNRALAVEVDLSNAGGHLRSGLFAEAEIIVDSKARVLAVPASAVVEFAGVEKVWVVKNGVAKEKPIRSGRRNHELVEVLEGLAVGDPVVSDARQGLAGPAAPGAQSVAAE